MNILFLDSIEPQTYGGMEEWIRLTAGGLAERGHHVVLAGRPGSEFLNRVGGGNASLTTVALNISGDFNPATIAKLKRLLTGHQIDVISVNFNKDVRLGGLAARLDGRTRVVWSVGLDITKGSFAHRVLTPKLVDSVIVPSESLKQQITRWGYIPPEIVTVIPIGIPDIPLPTTAERETARRRLGVDSGAVLAVTSGRFVEHKGHRYLVEAAAHIADKHPDVHYLFLGDGPLRPELENRIEVAGLTNRFILTGMIGDVPAVLPAADLMIHPSVDEPFGIAILEGMRAGLPIIAARVGGIPEVVGGESAAELVSPADSQALARAISKVISDPATRETMARAARGRYLKQFRYDTMIERAEASFASVCKASGSAHGTA